MVYRNETSLYYAKAILNGVEFDLGRTNAVDMQPRLMSKIKGNIHEELASLIFVMSPTKEGLNQAIKSTAKKEYEHEGLNPDSPLYGLDKDVIDSIVQIDDETPSPFAGVTMNRLMEAQASPEYKAYLIFALHPDKRVGVSGDDIKDCRIEWEQAYPDVATHCPKWVDE